MDDNMLIELEEAISLTREEMLTLPEGSEERARAGRTYSELLKSRDEIIKLKFDMNESGIQKAKDREFQKEQAEIDRKLKKKIRWVELSVGAATTVVVAVGGVLLDKFGLEPFSKIWHSMLNDSTRQKK